MANLDNVLAFVGGAQDVDSAHFVLPNFGGPPDQLLDGGVAVLGAFRF